MADEVADGREILAASPIILMEGPLRFERGKTEGNTQEWSPRFLQRTSNLILRGTKHYIVQLAFAKENIGGVPF